MSLVIISELCPYCQKARSPQDIQPLPGNAKICSSCREQHEAALLALSGLKADSNGNLTSSAPPPVECGECHVTPAELKAQGRNGDKWSVIPFGEVYRFFCTGCADRIVSLRSELYRGTEFAKQRGL